MTIRQRRLGEFGEFRNGLNYSSANFGRGLKVISVKDFGDRWRPDLSILDEINPSGLRVEQSDLRAGDILFVRSNGNKELVGRSMLIEDDLDDVSFSGFCIRFRPTATSLNSKFLSSYFRTPLFRRTLSLQGKGTNINNLNQAILERMVVPCPSKAVQERIVDIVGSYDDLIENNRRRIALLEQAARLLYREWFVRFRFPGHEHAKIIDGIPEGWERRTLGEVADVRLGKMLDEKKNRGELRPYLANVNVRWGRFEVDSLRKMRFEPHEVKKYGLMPGDIVMCEGGEPGRCAIWKDQVPGMMLQKALHRIRAHEGLDQRFLYHCLSFMAKSGRLAGLFTGTTIKHLPREKLITVAVVAPPKRLVLKFAEQAAPMEAQIGTLEAASRRAAEARDLLLPRLMNGEIAV
ncbi:restriction endonuclease subunit S [Telmatospirillum siberiense]|uniref:Type I restriction modification DNA specificity domain-containing protein n=1 Tax=Telmatospirillum siberiense TaxID=382514 RepID=A0A2N3PY08_9PROT|nr:restriction endonuclease subunit S [Telmatospirillum siberiense]PKU25255.1 hypothetical protein CWS72_06530 [Telmatospirillum siberiense]